MLNLRPRSFINACRDFMAIHEEQADLTAGYSGITVPVGMLYGTGDRILDPAEHRAALTAKLPLAECELIEGAGHMIPISSADRCAQFIARMAQRVKTAALPGRQKRWSRHGRGARRRRHRRRRPFRIDAGYHLQAYCPNKSYAILEARDAIGGTWDLFRYPGIRSDSDMYTFGYSFRPWQSDAAIAEGAAIRSNIRETAEAYGIDRKIRFRHRVTRAAWSSAAAQWTLEVERGEARKPATMTCNFLFGCTGYYDYAAGYMPKFPGIGLFRGRVVHPQQWPGNLDYAGKRVVVIGSGATAVTIVPAIANTAAHVTMLQRSPTYIVALPTRNAFANWLRRHLPVRAAFTMPAGSSCCSEFTFSGAPAANRRR